MYYGQLVQLEVSRFSNPHTEKVARQVEKGSYVPAVLVRINDQTCLIVNDTPSEVDNIIHHDNEPIAGSFVVNGKLIGGAEGNRFYFRAEYMWVTY